MNCWNQTSIDSNCHIAHITVIPPRGMALGTWSSFQSSKQYKFKKTYQSRLKFQSLMKDLSDEGDMESRTHYHSLLFNYCLILIPAWSDIILLASPFKVIMDLLKSQDSFLYDFLDTLFTPFNVTPLPQWLIRWGHFWTLKHRRALLLICQIRGRQSAS